MNHIEIFRLQTEKRERCNVNNKNHGKVIIHSYVKRDKNHLIG